MVPRWIFSGKVNRPNSDKRFLGGSGGGASQLPVALLAYRAMQNTNGGDLTAGAWRTIPLTNKVYDPSSLVTLSSNTFTLQAGTYEIETNFSFFDTNRSQTRLYNNTDSIEEAVGGSVFAFATRNNTAGSSVVYKVSLASPKEFELQANVASTRTDTGFGVAANFTTEQFATVLIREL